MLTLGCAKSTLTGSPLSTRVLFGIVFRFLHDSYFDCKVYNDELFPTH